MSRLTLLRKARREKFLCAEPGCPEVTGDEYRCARHKAEHAERAAWSYRPVEGSSEKCSGCSKPGHNVRRCERVAA